MVVTPAASRRSSTLTDSCEYSIQRPFQVLKWSYSSMGRFTSSRPIKPRREYSPAVLSPLIDHLSSLAVLFLQGICEHSREDVAQYGAALPPFLARHFSLYTAG
jgi:hypothetical protein